MTRTIKYIASTGMTLLIILAVLGFFFDWNILAAWQWFWGAIKWLFFSIVNFLVDSDIFRGIFS